MPPSFQRSAQRTAGAAWRARTCRFVQMPTRVVILASWSSIPLLAGDPVAQAPIKVVHPKEQCELGDKRGQEHLEHPGVHVDLAPAVDHRIRMEGVGDARHDEEEEWGHGHADQGVDGGEAGALLLVRHRAAQGEVGAVEDEDQDDRGLPRVPIPVLPPHDTRPQGAGHRGEDAVDEADLDRRNGGAVVLRPPPRKIAEAPVRRDEEGDEGRPGERDVEVEDAARVADETGRRRRIEEGGPDDACRPQPECPEREGLHGFHTRGKTIRPTNVMTASYRRSWTSATPAGAPPTALRVSSTARRRRGRRTGKASTAKRVERPWAWAMMAAMSVLPAARP